MMLANIWQSKISKSDKQKLLGVNIDKHYKFEKLFVNQCKEAGQKLSVFAVVCNILNQKCS